MSGTTGQFTDEVARAKAEEIGCDVLYGNDETLQLDLDSDEAFYTFQSQLLLLVELKLIKPVADEDVSSNMPSYEVLKSRNGNRHVVVKLATPVYSMRERILLQALLGSDLKREALSFAGYLDGQQNPILLFRPRPQFTEGEATIA